MQLCELGKAVFQESRGSNIYICNIHKTSIHRLRKSKELGISEERLNKETISNIPNDSRC